MIYFLLLFSLATYTLCLNILSGQWYSVLLNGNNLTIVEGKNVSGSLAWGVYFNETFTDGWGKLSLYSVNFTSNQVANAAGYLQGALELNYTKFHKINSFDSLFGGQTTNKKIVNFTNQQYAFIKRKIASSKDVYWKTLGYWISFYEGMIQGYNDAVPLQKKITPQDFLLLQLFGDGLELVQRWSYVPPVSKTLKQKRKDQLENSHCSVIVKIADDFSDVFMGHNTWSDGQTMLRTYKFYSFGNDVQFNFAGYPGQIFSGDDYYVLTRPDQMMWVTETSLDIVDEGILDGIYPSSVLTWQRVMVANTLATNGSSWTSIFSKFNSGTYNNQFIVVDMKLFQKGVGVKTGFIWIVEQMPRLIISKDVTVVTLKNGNYWASYNIPFQQKIWKYSGAYYPDYNFKGDSRAKLFKRLQTYAQNITGIRWILRYNKYQTDPESKKDPMETIASRADLYKKEADQDANFAYDAKVTSYSKIMSDGCIEFQNDLASDIQNGPTHDDQRVFRWSDYKFKNSHLGQPNEWNYTWVTVQIAK